ncbi:MULTISPECIES: hypothetical protein [Actinomycetaceae]|uniref:hypothetical protein n=1 Tax=Actinomycetaceae TaxID=2049 RepID=UPI00039790C1|nr:MULTISPECIES: hypothetical protein [Actinomycetaceae]ERH24469.1 hypothetical protein HMPREF1980_01823 [Actinomyces sp. oral taxon 172 str. F0311]WLD77907.1 hypothetical protein QU663_09860 [Schaalia sp. HMT-172]
MSENEIDVERDRAEDERDNVVLTGEEIELPGEGSDASAIIGESSEPIHTGEIESVAIGSLKARVPATAPLKPAIEDKISTGELPVVSAPAGDLPAVSPTDQAGAPSGAEDAPADASSDAPEADGSAQREGATSEADAAHSEADAASSDEAAAAGDATEEAPVEQGTEAPAQEAPSDEPADAPAEASSTERAEAAPSEDADEAESDEPSAPVAEEAPAEETPAEEAAAQGEDATDDEPEQVGEPAEEASDAPEQVGEPAEEREPARSPVMTPAQAAAALGLNLDSVREPREETADETADAPQDAPTDNVEETPVDNAEEHADEATTAEGTEASKDAEEPVSAVGGAAAEATHTLASRRSMIFGDEEPVSPSIPALSPTEQQASASSAQEPVERDTASDEDTTKDSVTALVDGPTKQLPTQATSYSFADQDQAEAERPRRRSLLGADDDERDAATLAAIASANRDRSENTKEPAGLDDELFSAAPVITEMPSRRGAHFLSLVLFLVLTPFGWYLASDAGARMTLADAAPMYTGVASILALGELLGAIIVAVILFATARRSSLGAWIMGVATLIVGLPWVLAPGITASTLLASLNALSASSSLGANLSHHLQASGYSGRFAILGIVLMGVGYLSHSARRTGRAEEALRTSIEAVNPAGAFYSKRARKKAAKDLSSK